MKHSKAKSLWLSISLLALIVCCKSKQSQVAEPMKEKDMEQPMPVMEQQTDSLKRMLDIQRQEKKKD